VTCLVSVWLLCGRGKKENPPGQTLFTVSTNAMKSSRDAPRLRWHSSAMPLMTIVGGGCQHTIVSLAMTTPSLAMMMTMTATVDSSDHLMTISVVSLDC
jgi:hypothetical protein